MDGDSDGGFGSDSGFGGSGFGVSDSAAAGFGTEGFGTSAGFGEGGFGFGDTTGFGQEGFGSAAGFGEGGLNANADTFGYSSLGSLSEDGLGPSFSLADFSQDMGYSSPQGFSFADAPSLGAFGTPSFNQDEDGFGKFAKSVFSFISNPVVSTIGKMADKSGLFGPAMNVANIANKSATAPSLAESNAAVGKGLTGIGLGMIGGPVGMAAGLAAGALGLGSSLGGVTANQGMSGVPGQGTDGLGGGMIGDVAQGLAGLYMGNRAKGQYNQALNGLNDIYSPNGVYAQQLRQQMERRDAAAGRRSQYGPREAQLMAALADSQARTMSSPGYANLMQQRGIAQNQGLNTLLALMAKNPGAMSRAGKYIGDGIGAVMNGGGLGSLFNGGYSNNWDMPADSGPQLPDSFLGDNWWGGGEGYFGE